jgi:uncharacterized membrane protein YdcZ (DUF606 family)
METIFIPLALLAGGLLPIQAGANAQLSKSVASPFVATTLQLFVGAAVLLLITTLAGSLAALAGLSAAPWWHAIGGLVVTMKGTRNAMNINAMNIMVPITARMMNTRKHHSNKRLFMAQIPLSHYFGTCR